MKKIALLAVSVLIAGTSAIAQTSTTSTTTVGTTKWGLKAGVNLAKYSFGKDDADNPTSDQVTSFHITGYADIPLGRAFSLQPGLSLQGKGAEFESTLYNEKQDLMYLEVPVNFVGKIPLGTTGSNFYLGAGPYAALGISGQRKITTKATGSENTSDLEFGDEAGDQLSAFDFGINALAGVQLGSGINFGAGYGLGLRDLRPNATSNEGQVNNRVLSFSVGFAF
jgi:opacity protein-like surface antigen